jgi:hypothetical protein
LTGRRSCRRRAARRSRWPVRSSCPGAALGHLAQVAHVALLQEDGRAQRGDAGGNCSSTPSPSSLTVRPPCTSHTRETQCVTRRPSRRPPRSQKPRRQPSCRQIHENDGRVHAHGRQRPP